MNIMLTNSNYVTRVKVNGFTMKLRLIGGEKGNL